MDDLRKYGFKLDKMREDLKNDIINNLDVNTMQMLRAQLFIEAKVKDLIHQNDDLVSRHNCAKGPPLKFKLAADISELAYALKNYLSVPRVLVKNGKRSAMNLAISRERASKNNTSTLSSKSNQPTSPMTIIH
jgi:hypothetical protein